MKPPESKHHQQISPKDDSAGEEAMSYDVDKLSCVVDKEPTLIAIGDLAGWLAKSTGEDEFVWFIRLKTAGNAGELPVRHFPDGRRVGDEGSLRDMDGGRHFMALAGR